MKKFMVLIVICISAVAVYAETENSAFDNTSKSTSNNTSSVENATGTANNSGKSKVKYISAFQDDYSKPKVKEDESQAKNETAQSVTTVGNQAASQSDAKTKEETVAYRKALVSK